MNPNLAQARGNLADVLSAWGYVEGTADKYRRAIQLDPEACTAHLSLGQILARSLDIAEARAHLAKAAHGPDPEIRQTAQKALR